MIQTPPQRMWTSYETARICSDGRKQEIPVADNVEHRTQGVTPDAELHDPDRKATRGHCATTLQLVLLCSKLYQGQWCLQLPE